MSELTLNDYARDLALNATRVQDIADEAADLVARGDLDGASLVLGSQTGKLDRLTTSYTELLQEIVKAGGDWQRRPDTV